MKTEAELRAKLDEMLAIDAVEDCGPLGPTKMMFSKAAVCKSLLWALGENDDDRWFITSCPGPPVDRSCVVGGLLQGQTRGKERN